MRIIAGAFRGRLLETTRDLSIRPTTDRAKQTMFDVLSTRVNYADINILDLFSGSGSLGLEAVSRGAKHTTFVDKSQKSLGILNGNIKKLGCEQRCRVYQADVFWFLKNINMIFDVVFADPPYALENIGMLPNAIYDSGVVRNGSYIIMEHSRRSEIVLDSRKYEILKKPFGQTTVLILKAIVPRTV